MLDLLNAKKLRRALLYFLCLLAALWLQLEIFSRHPLPGGAKPFFIPVLVAAVGLWEGGVWGAAFGLVAGFFCDIEMLSSVVTFLVTFAVLGFFSGLLADYFINQRFVAYLILAALSLALTAAVQALPLWLLRDAPGSALLPVAVFQSLWSLPFAVPAYFLVRRISGKRRAE